MEIDPPRAEKDFEGTWPNASRSTQSVGCADDDVRVCNYYLPAHNGVRPCIVGYQVCSDNMWSRCIEGVLQDGGVPSQAAGAIAVAPTDAGSAPQADAGAASGN